MYLDNECQNRYKVVNNCPNRLKFLVNKFKI